MAIATLQVTDEKRISKGLTSLAAYTWSHSIDDPSEDNGGGPRNAYNLTADKGNSDFDIRQRLVVSWTYQLPFGPGRRCMNGATGIGRQLLGGWQVGGIETFMIGYLFNLSATQNPPVTSASSNEHRGRSSSR
jgi:hypothetical protein